MIDAIKDFAPSILSDLKSFLHQGGAVFLMDTPHNRHPVSNQLLSEFDMAIDYDCTVRGTVFDTHLNTVGEINLANKINGGDSLLVNREGNSVLSIQKYGDGLIMVFTASHLFRDEVMGFTNSIPNEYQYWLSRIEFWMLGSIAEKLIRINKKSLLKVKPSSFQ